MFKKLLIVKKEAPWLDCRRLSIKNTKTNINDTIIIFEFLECLPRLKDIFNFGRLFYIYFLVWSLL